MGFGDCGREFVDNILWISEEVIRNFQADIVVKLMEVRKFHFRHNIQCLSHSGSADRE